MCMCVRWGGVINFLFPLFDWMSGSCLYCSDSMDCVCVCVCVGKGGLVEDALSSIYIQQHGQKVNFLSDWSFKLGRTRALSAA